MPTFTCCSPEFFAGNDIYDSLLHFYTVVRDLYAAGNLGGIKVYAQKPLGW